MMFGAGFPIRCCAAITLVLAAVAACATPGREVTVDELKARVAATSIGERPKLCLQIAERQMDEASKLFVSGEIEKAQLPLTDVVAYSELARDYAIQSHKHQKQSEIAVRGMARKLTEILHSLTQSDQAPVRNAVQRLQHVRDDLLESMFPKGMK